MAAKPISLSVHRNTRAKRERRQVWAALQQKAREMPKDVDGMALVAFSRKSSTTLNVIGTFFVRDPADRYLLPEMAHQVLRERIE